jgi:hypothetical protein
MSQHNHLQRPEHLADKQEAITFLVVASLFLAEHHLADTNMSQWSPSNPPQKLMLNVTGAPGSASSWEYRGELHAGYVETVHDYHTDLDENHLMSHTQLRPAFQMQMGFVQLAQ